MTNQSIIHEICHISKQFRKLSEISKLANFSLLNVTVTVVGKHSVKGLNRERALYSKSSLFMPWLQRRVVGTFLSPYFMLYGISLRYCGLCIVGIASGWSLFHSCYGSSQQRKVEFPSPVENLMKTYDMHIVLFNVDVNIGTYESGIKLAWW